MPINKQNKKMNKKGDIPVTILVIGVFVICALALLSFVKFNLDSDKDFVGIGLIETVLAVEEEVGFDEATSGFNREGVKISIDEGIITGTYTVKESSWKFLEG